MVNYFIDKLKISPSLQFFTAIFVILTIWWLSILFQGFVDNPQVDYFTLVYPILALLGGVQGWIFAQKWGGLKSALGKAVLMLSFGLLTQFLGQLLYNYYVFVLGIEVPYPSIGDISYFASVIFYVIGVAYLAKVSGIKFSVNTASGKLLAFLIPVGMLLLSYLLLLRGYDIESSGWAVLFLDFGFPIGQAIFVSVALLILFISKNILGGIMRMPIILLTFALIVQFIADFAFSYAYSQGMDVYAMDYIYFLAYFLMSIALVSIGNMFYQVQKT